MEQNIAISTINDFLFCPKSLYMHMAAGELNPATYHDVPQTRGNALHSAIDNKTYSSRKDIMQGASIYSEELGIYGKLDTFDKKGGELTERKSKVSEIYEGYLMQLYAEYFCLVEMGYDVKSISIYSMLDNKKHKFASPGEREKNRLKEILQQMRDFNEEDVLKHKCNHCSNNIYSGLNW